MSKQSKVRAIKRKRHTKKKDKRVAGKNHVPVYQRKKLRFVGYVSYFCAQDFSGRLCIKTIDPIMIEVKYTTPQGPDVIGDFQYVRVAVYSSLQNLPMVDQLLMELVPSKIEKNFQSMTCRDSIVEISDENLRLVGALTSDEVDQFKDDLKCSDFGNEIETIFYQLTSNHKNVIVEIYADDFMKKFIVSLLKKGRMSEKWGDKFYVLGGE